MALLPGWASDHRVFSDLDLDYNYLIPERFFFAGFKEELLRELERLSIDKISLLGWSLGGFLAAEFASLNPERVSRLILLGIRRRFDPLALKDTEIKLRKNKKGYLYKFYLEWFFNKEKEGFSRFRKELLGDYIRNTKLKDLKSGLDYLSMAELDLSSLGKISKVTIFHGDKDKIAPINEARELSSQLPGVDFITLKNRGHFPFLDASFKRMLHKSLSAE